MAQTYPYSCVNPVYFSAGKFDGSQSNRFLRAPFDLLTINGSVYFQPSPQAFSTQAIAQTSSADLEQADLSRQPGGFYSDLNPIVMDACELGDGSDSWKGLHDIGWV